ncbi:hypothetical protein [Actinokineospora sp.]|uniref:hypothetical protein n=1 Tax=Actinokineospora sp. TaxID=1872133 RepID=UPI004037D2FB
MGFFVDKNGMAAWPVQVDRLRNDAVSATKHLVEQTDINWVGEGIANLIQGGHRACYDRAFDFYDNASAHVFVNYHNAAKHTLDTYLRTDQAGAERIDATYPGADDPDARAGGLEAACNQAMAMNVQWSAQRMPDVWRGNAAEHAVAYLYELANTIDASTSPLFELASYYESAAKSCMDTRDVASDLLDKLLDPLAIAVLAAGAASAIAASGVGLPVALILAGFSISAIYTAAKFVVGLAKVAADLKTVVETTTAAQGRFGLISAELALPHLPEVPPLP